MLDGLIDLFSNISLEWIDFTKNLEETSKFEDFLKHFPNLIDIFGMGKEKDFSEFQRTIRHIFRVFKIFFSLKKGTFSHRSLSNSSISLLEKKVQCLNDKEDFLMALILAYHDIGRFVRKSEHPFYSFKVIREDKLLSNFNLKYEEELLVLSVIKYHLLFATIYTGESTYLSVYSLVYDGEFKKLVENKKYIDLFVDLLEIFTFIDVLGYSYSQIYDHYLKYYDEINKNLKSLLNHFPNDNIVLSEALKLSLDFINWRLAGALRIFQFVETEPFLTEEFYYDKLKESLESLNEKLIKNFTWKGLMEEISVQVSKIQIKYGLPCLMLLAFGRFHRAQLKKDTKISYRLILFWMLLSKKLSEFIKNEVLIPCNVFFFGIPNWFSLKREIIEKIDYDFLNNILNNSKYEFDEERKEFKLYLDFSKLLKHDR
ncbi:MAG: hypothetical protein ACTSUX_14015 [Promethearchaeota archaeon]